MKLSLVFLLTVGCSKAPDSPSDERAEDAGDCRGPGNYQAGKEGSYRPCCEGLTEQFQELPATNEQGERVCIAPPLRVYACVEGSCGDGRCEVEEAVPCGCPADCPNAMLPSAGRCGADGGACDAENGLDAGDDDASVSLVPAGLTRVVIEWSSGHEGGPRFGECDGSYVQWLRLELAPGTFSWDLCLDSRQRIGRIHRGERALSEAELRAIHNALSVVGPGATPRCGLDGSPVRLILESPEQSVTYQDINGCAREQPLVVNIDALHAALFTFAERATLPETFDLLELSAARRVLASPDSASTCSSKMNPEYRLDVATRQLSWKRCEAPSGSNVFALVTGSKQLSAAELAGLRGDYAQIKFGASYSCAELREIALAVGGPGSPEERADPELHSSQLFITNGESWVPTVSEEGTCSREHGASGPVTGMRALEDKLTALADLSVPAP